MFVSHRTWGPFEQKGWEEKKRNEDDRGKRHAFYCCLDNVDLRSANKYLLGERKSRHTK